MNPHNDAALPFFMQYLESQTSPIAEDPDTLSAQKCTGFTTAVGSWCILDTYKYPTDGDDDAGPMR